MPSASSNKAIVASAGSGKTEEIVVRALALPINERILMTTYTDNGTNEIRQRLASKAGLIPSNIEVMPWFTFLLRHGIKPYQYPVMGINGVKGLFFDSRPGRPRKENARDYYFSKAGLVYRDFAAEAVLMLDDLNDGAVFTRIGQHYDHVFYDEIQDISARDPEVIEKLIDHIGSVTLVGDPRQGTFSTAQSRTNRKFTGSRIMTWLEKLERAGKLEIDHQTHSMRCNQLICDVADALNPSMFSTESRNNEVTGHDGVFLILEEHIADYVAMLGRAPQVLTWNKNGRDFGLGSRNMGDVKGLTFDRVIISPTGTMEKYFTAGTTLADTTKAKLYVGLTRARSSVAIVVEKQGTSSLPLWLPA